MPRKMMLFYGRGIIISEFFGLVLGSAWATISLLSFKSSVFVFIPFIVITLIFFLVLTTCLWGRLKTHSYFTLKQQEKHLKKSLLAKNQQ